MPTFTCCSDKTFRHSPVSDLLLWASVARFDRLSQLEPAVSAKQISQTPMSSKPSWVSHGRSHLPQVLKELQGPRIGSLQQVS